jgi:peptidoglycan/xylan/chitin deacetylase (PgdA/CDA1 family)
MHELPPILAYHKVERRAELGVTRLSPRRFARQIERLARAGWRALSLHEVIACARGERAVGERELAITFDDAYRGLRENAFPVLAAHGFSATCFVITDYAGKLNRWDVAYGGRRFAHLAWRDIERARGRGIEFASHTATHARLDWLSDAAARRDLLRSRETLESALGMPCDAVSYPFGIARARECALAREAGYTAGFTMVRAWHGDAMSIPRTPVYVWSPPTPVVGWLAPVERFGAIGANRCAVGTSYIQRASAAART